MRVRADLNISLDGIAAPPVGTPEQPFGEDWGHLVAAYLATRTMQEQVFGKNDTGTTGVDDAYARRYFEGTGAEIMGAHKFGLDLYGDDPDWKGWWGPNPPFHMPVFVLTDRERPTLEMEGGTTFHFISAEPQDALHLAMAAADGQDVRIGGGPTVVKDYLRAGLVDELHVAIAPIVLNHGISLWDDLRGLEADFDVRSEAAESGTSHVTFTRKVLAP
ncbi:dihydrofolate reductase family protein [Aeromicrobium alkaliterrae]|uniref:Dihydrofolate reductase family protein n=1 Tax=Aeromicrobium alkaliterrae TaxID=302168 RepID=A0ABN2JFG0_9ACTN